MISLNISVDCHHPNIQLNVIQFTLDFTKDQFSIMCVQCPIPFTPLRTLFSYSSVLATLIMFLNCLDAAPSFAGCIVPITSFVQ
jgi:hypothetical protein